MPRGRCVIPGKNFKAVLTLTRCALPQRSRRRLFQARSASPIHAQYTPTANRCRNRLRTPVTNPYSRFSEKYMVKGWSHQSRSIERHCRTPTPRTAMEEDGLSSSDSPMTPSLTTAQMTINLRKPAALLGGEANERPAPPMISDLHLGQGAWPPMRQL